MKSRTVIEAIASSLTARANCIKAGNTEWQEKHEDTLKALTDRLPSGSGWDHGTTIDMERSRENRVVLTGAYHHMDEHGYYDGWTDHAIFVTPTFDGFDVTVKGRDRNQIKDYLADLFHYALSRPEVE